jgi:transcriptional regulator with XRE-family HTH domain
MASSTAEKFATVLRRFRAAAGLSQEELAEKTGVSVRTISDMERGQRSAPRPETLRLLADGLGIPTDDRSILFSAALPEIDAAPMTRAAVTGLSSEERAWDHTLPAPLTRLIGRETVLADLTDMLVVDDVRLVTLTGPGGVGKTRLAVEAARGASPRFEDGAAFVGLASVTDPQLVTATIAQTLGMAVTGGSLSDRLGKFLEKRQLLLVLDNFEHLIESAPLVSTILAAAPRLSVLVTSRMRLRLSGEMEYAVPALDLPTDEIALDGLQSNAALNLFAERARSIQPAFAITD